MLVFHYELAFMFHNSSWVQINRSCALWWRASLQHSLLQYPTILMFTARRWKMADSSGSNPQSPGFTEKLKSWLCWSWTYICALWFAMVLTMVYVLRSPLKLQETVNAGLCLWSAVCMFTAQHRVYFCSLKEKFIQIWTFYHYFSCPHANPYSFLFLCNIKAEILKSVLVGVFHAVSMNGDWRCQASKMTQNYR